MSKILVTGSKAGLGRDIVECLAAAGHTVYEYDISDGLDVLDPQIVCDELDVLVNNAGVNGIDMLENVTDELWDQVVGVNAKGIMKMSQKYLPHLIRSEGTILNVVSNAAHLPMTSSICYNSSKGAALMASRQMARELGRRWGITVFSVSPNRLHGTPMSDKIDDEVIRTRGWTREFAREYQLASLPAGEETDPKEVAGLIAYLLHNKRRHKYLAGCDIQYGL